MCVWWFGFSFGEVSTWYSFSFPLPLSLSSLLIVVMYKFIICCLNFFCYDFFFFLYSFFYFCFPFFNFIWKFGLLCLDKLNWIGSQWPRVYACWFISIQSIENDIHTTFHRPNRSKWKNQCVRVQMWWAMEFAKIEWAEENWPFDWTLITCTACGELANDRAALCQETITEEASPTLRVSKQWNTES